MTRYIKGRRKLVRKMVRLRKGPECYHLLKWMELENIILSEVSLAQKTKNCMFSLICGY
jgi:hypothetical protein